MDEHAVHVGEPALDGLGFRHGPIVPVRARCFLSAPTCGLRSSLSRPGQDRRSSLTAGRARSRPGAGPPVEPVETRQDRCSSLSRPSPAPTPGGGEALVADRVLGRVDAGWWDGFGDPVRGDHEAPFVLVDQVVVEAAHQGPVGQVGGSALGPGDRVVGLAPGRRSFAAGEHAAAVPHGQARGVGAGRTGGVPDRGRARRSRYRGRPGRCRRCTAAGGSRRPRARCRCPTALPRPAGAVAARPG